MMLSLMHMVSKERNVIVNDVYYKFIHWLQGIMLQKWSLSYKTDFLGRKKEVESMSYTIKNCITIISHLRDVNTYMHKGKFTTTLELHFYSSHKNCILEWCLIKH